MVSFVVHCPDTRLGFHVRVVGSCSYLGTWVPAKGLVLQTTAQDFPLWYGRCQRALLGEEPIEYKFVICGQDGQACRWEDERPNRCLRFGPPSGPSASQRVTIAACFNQLVDADVQVETSQSLLPLRAKSCESDCDSGNFCPTLRERINSGSHIPSDNSTPELEHPPRLLDQFGRKTSSHSTLFDGMAQQDAEHTSPGSTRSFSSQLLVREESSSNLFVDQPSGSDCGRAKMAGQTQFDNRYALVGSGPLGEGSFGLVWRCVLKPSDQGSPRPDQGEERAAKIVRKARLQSRDARLLLGEDGEVETHMRMQHEHIVTLLEFFDEPLAVTLVLEYCRGGDLFDAIVRQKRAAYRGLTEPAAAVALSHVLQALSYLHGRRIVHRDLKCENVLLAFAGTAFEQNVFKLCDFGFAAYDRYGHGLNDRLGSPDTVAPEVVIGMTYSFPVDLWASGVMLYMMITAIPPFFAPTDGEVLRRVQEGRYSLEGPIWKSVSSSVKTFIRALMDMDPNRRPLAEHALQHAWFGNLPPKVERVHRRRLPSSWSVFSGARSGEPPSPTCTSCMGFLAGGRA